MKGCGALTGWTWDNGSPPVPRYAGFYLPFIIKSGCVERAIVAAGGPKLECTYKGNGKPNPFPFMLMPVEKRDTLEKRDTIEDTIEKQHTLVKRDTISSSSSSSPTPTPYTPEVWGAGNTVTLTTTYESASASIYTTIFNLGTLIGGNVTSLSGSTGTLSATSSAPSATSSSNISNDGRCGPDNDNTICPGSVYSNCCSVWGWYGSEADTCGHLICDTQYGICDPVPEEPPVS
jgi:hypothetical protein